MALGVGDNDDVTPEQILTTLKQSSQRVLNHHWKRSTAVTAGGAFPMLSCPLSICLSIRLSTFF